MITQDQIMHRTVRALWWKPPFGDLMLFGKQETRTWDTKYRGLVLICNSLKPYTSDLLIHLSLGHIERIGKTLKDHQTLLGHAIAIGHLTGVKRMIDYPHIKNEIEEKTFVQWRDNLFIHEYEDVTPIEPFPFKGKQGWLTLSPEQKQLIKLKPPSP